MWASSQHPRSNSPSSIIAPPAASSSPPATIPSNGTRSSSSVPMASFLIVERARGYANWRRGIPCHEPNTMRSAAWRRIRTRFPATSPPCSRFAESMFPRPPEPVPENLQALGALVRRKKADIGIAVDPDVDRLAIVDEKGRPIGEDYTLAFAIRAVLGRSDGRAVGRSVVCNLSTSLVVEDAARDYGARLGRAPVGEAYVARKIIEMKAVIGGEGNGGVMYPALHVGRDAPVAGALVLSLLARERITVSALVARAPRYTIVKAKLARGPDLGPVYAGLRRGFPDASVDTQDGLRLSWPDRWLHVRPSGTEPIIRLIAEAPSRADAEQLIEEGRRLCAAS